MSKLLLAVLFVALIYYLFGFLFDAKLNLEGCNMQNTKDCIQLVYNLTLGMVLAIGEVCVLLAYLISSLNKRTVD